VEFDDVIRKRRMVRAYQDRPVDDAIVQKILAHAHQAPSAGFKQPQEFIVVRQPEIKRALGRAAFDQMYLAEAPVVIVVCADTSRPAERYGKRGREFYSVIDGAFAAMIILLTAVSQGLGCAFVGAFDDAQVARVLGMPRHVRPIGIMPIGYSAEAPEQYDRIPLERIVHEDGW
jgi:nitroreductase